jgi:hypothetical protein
VPVLIDEVQSIVIGQNHHVKKFLFEFLLVQCIEIVGDIFIVVFLCIHIFDLQIHFITAQV